MTATPDGHVLFRNPYNEVMLRLAKDQAIYAQLRLIDPELGQPAYLNPPANGTTRHPRPLQARSRRHPEILVTNGIIDALSANAAGYRTAAVLSSGTRPGRRRGSRPPGPPPRTLVLALDLTGPGDEAADRLMLHLEARGRRPLMLPALNGDLNDSLVTAHDWPRNLAAPTFTTSAPPTHPPGPYPMSIRHPPDWKGLRSGKDWHKGQQCPCGSVHGEPIRQQRSALVVP